MHRRLRRLAASLVLVLAVALAPLLAFNASGDRWPDGAVTMHLQLGSPNGTLLDGAASWDAVAESALNAWNNHTSRTRFTVVRGSSAPIAYGNGTNNVFWSSTVYGDAWGSRTIGICMSRTVNGLFAETDVLFNVNQTWNSYRGPLRSAGGGATLNELFRTALHEFGHALGLDHPDEIGQRVSAIMNATTDNTEALTADDIAGARAIYATSVTAPPPTPTVSLEGSAGFSFAGSSGSLRIDAVQNNSATRTTGTLRLELWALPLHFADGLPSGSRLLARHTFTAPLPPGNRFANVNVSTTFTTPPTGSYYVALVLSEFTGGSGTGYIIRDHREFSNPLTIGNPAAPVITSQPAGTTLLAGGTASLNVVVSGALPIAYQWFKDGSPITGATSTAFTVSNARETDAGTYTVTATNPLGTATSNPARLTLGSAANPGRLINLSILTAIATPGDSFTMGYVIGGANTSGSKPLVIRAAGPSLGALGVPGTLGNPRLELFAGSNKTQDNDDWGGTAPLAAAMQAVGAFPFAASGSLDAAVLATVGAGDNSVKVSGIGTGTVIGEIYDATPPGSFTTATPRLLNVSVIKHIGSGLTAGFVIGGSTPRRILVRAIGPGLAPFGITDDAVADPQLTLRSESGAVLATNNDWGNTAELNAAFTQVSAFALPANSRDAAIVSLLEPGNYTAEVRGNNGTGIAIIEIYEVP